jgi:phosphoribosylformylglycinamidine cyclo-ligase
MSESCNDSAPSYREAGVDLATADCIKQRLKAVIEPTFGNGVVTEIGGFAGGYDLSSNPDIGSVLVASADGVGTKVLVAQLANRHNTVGEDLVNHCVDDLLAAGAKPLFFLDYIATGKLDPEIVISIVNGFARGCGANAIPLLGGETAEMPDLYPIGTYDLAGFAVGSMVAQWGTSDNRVQTGDVILGLGSTGLHTNGYSLARRIVFDIAGQRPEDVVPWAETSWADELLAVHRSYLKPVGPLLGDKALHAAAHITGGGFSANLTRVLPPGSGAVIDRSAWTPAPLFDYLATAGSVDSDEMYRVFNMGIGFCLIVSAQRAGEIAKQCQASGQPALIIGEVVAGEGLQWA